jgi:hypothetical protein
MPSPKRDNGLHSPGARRRTGRAATNPRFPNRGRATIRLARLARLGPRIAACFLAVCLSAPFRLRAAPAPGAELTYTRTLAGSTPEYLRVSVHSDGSATFEARQLDEPPDARPLKLSETTTGQLFALAAELNNFRSVDLESHKKVANLGLKTFTYQSGSEKNVVQFNYSLQKPARDLTDLFERIASVEEHVEALEHGIKYDPLGLPQELLRIQVDLDNKALADAELMVPPLEQIASNPKFLRVAQVRAQDILNTVSHDK